MKFEFNFEGFFGLSFLDKFFLFFQFKIQKYYLILSNQFNPD
jgi:hypothetical protein